MPDVEVIQVIHTKLTSRGEGTTDDPYRLIEQYWLMDGTLVFEYDTYNGKMLSEHHQI